MSASSWRSTRGAITLLRNSTTKRKWSIGALLTGATAVALVIYAIALSEFLDQHQKATAKQEKAHHADRRQEKVERRVENRVGDTAARVSNAKRFKDWRDLAVRLARLPAPRALDELESNDPFGTRTFEKKLVDGESRKGGVLDLTDIRELFPCPNDRITLPDQRNHTKATLFRANTPGYFMFFQHLRKAGKSQGSKPSFVLTPEYCPKRKHGMEKLTFYFQLKVGRIFAPWQRIICHELPLANTTA